MVNNMAKATIKSENGSQIYLEGTPEEISKIISDFKKREEQLAEVKASRKAREKGTVTDFIINLKTSGFFDKPKTIFDIKSKLKEHAITCKITTLSGILINLVRKGDLSRKKIEKLWGYMKR